MYVITDDYSKVAFPILVLLCRGGYLLVLSRPLFSSRLDHLPVELGIAGTNYRYWWWWWGAGVCVTCCKAAAAAPVWRELPVIVWVFLCGGSRVGDVTATISTPVWRRPFVARGCGGSGRGGGSAITWSGSHLPHSFFFLRYGWANWSSLCGIRFVEAVTLGGGETGFEGAAFLKHDGPELGSKGTDRLYFR